MSGDAKTYRVISRVVNGVLPDVDKGTLAALIRRNEGKQLELTVKPFVPHRSLTLNAYYWSAVIPPIQAALRELGYEAKQQEVNSILADVLSDINTSQTHDFLKKKFIETTNQEDEPSTARMNRDEFWFYIEQIIRWAASELNISIPYPNETSANTTG